MADGCPSPTPDDPIVRSLMGVVDCNVRTLAHDGYSTLFAPSGGFGDILTVGLTIYVAIVGYQLMVGRTQLRVTDFALMAVKIGAVLALATQWDTYQAVVYRLLFDGPRQLATAMLGAIQPSQSQFHGDVFDGLQRAFDDLTGFATGYAAHAPAAASPLLGGTGLGALLLTAAGSTLILSTLGVLLAAKIVLALLLALGPLFIVMFLFDATRGVFEGWLRASLAFAIAPLASILLLGVLLVMLEPSLLQIEQQASHGVYILGPVYSVMILILVFVGVTAGALLAAGMVASGFRLPRRPPGNSAMSESSRTSTTGADRDVATQSRAARTAAAAVAQERRDAMIFSSGVGGDVAASVDRRTTITDIGGRDRSARDIAAAPVRLGQTPRRGSQPRTMRAGAGGAGGLR